LKIKLMLDEPPSRAIKARLVMDNLNIHSIASLYETFEPMEAGHPAKRPDIRYTPKHGSWANMTEIETNILKEQSLDYLIPNAVPMQTQIAAWEKSRNDSVKLSDSLRHRMLGSSRTS
jgi:hypothetical protein